MGCARGHKVRQKERKYFHIHHYYQQCSGVCSQAKARLAFRDNFHGALYSLHEDRNTGCAQRLRRLSTSLKSPAPPPTSCATVDSLTAFPCFSFAICAASTCILEL